MFRKLKREKEKIIAVVNKGDRQVSEMADYVIEIPETSECFSNRCFRTSAAACLLYCSI